MSFDLGFDFNIAPLGELLPCPLCGEIPEFVHTWTDSWWLECECGLEYHPRHGSGEANTPSREMHVKQLVLRSWNDHVERHAKLEALRVALAHAVNTYMAASYWDMSDAAHYSDVLYPALMELEE